jgi:outer membrane protein assembly factor BamB
MRTLSADSGELLWEKQLGSRVSGELLIKKERLMLVTENGRFLLLDATSGELLRNIPLTGIPIASAALRGQYLVVPLNSGATQTVVAQISLTPVWATD